MGVEAHEEDIDVDALAPRRIALGAEAEGDRLDRALARALPEISRARIKALIAAGSVRLGGATMTDPSRRVNAGALIDLAMPPAADPVPRGQDIPLSVAFEDDALIVIDKPAGLVVHPSAGHPDGTLVNALIAHCGESLSGVGGVRRPGIVHRLDKDTSGLLVVAKNDQAHRALAAQFADHGREGPLERAYVAIVWGRPARDRFTIDAAIDRAPNDRLRQAVRRDGRVAITHVAVEEIFLGGLASRLTCRLETGRTHQIRVHLSHAGHPLLGDETYGKGFATKATKLPEAARAALGDLGRQALHAATLGFEHPATGETLRFESPIPADLARLLEALR